MAPGRRLADGDWANLEVLPVMRTSALTVIILLLILSATLGLAPLLAPSTFFLTNPMFVPLVTVLTDALLSVELFRVGAGRRLIDTLVLAMFLGHLAFGTDTHFTLVIGNPVALALEYTFAGVPVLLVSLFAFTLVGPSVQNLGVGALGDIDAFSILDDLGSVTDALHSSGIGFVAVLAIDDAFLFVVLRVTLFADASGLLVVEHPGMSACRRRRDALAMLLYLGKLTDTHLALVIGDLSVLAIEDTHLLMVLLVAFFADAGRLCVVELLGVDANWGSSLALAMFVDGEFVGAFANVFVLVELQGLFALRSAHILVVRLEVWVLADTILADALLIVRAVWHARRVVVLLGVTLLALALVILVYLVLTGTGRLRGFIDMASSILVTATFGATNTAHVEGSSWATLAVVPA